MMIENRAESLPFRPRARLLRLLGDELIRNPNIAIFELVKNAYDADASYCRVDMSNVHDQRLGLIIVRDDGAGMDWNIVTGVWLEPGTDFRKQQKNRRSAKFGRLPLGEKGVGRFAAGKLGDVVQLVTRAKDQLEIVVDIDWNELLSHDYLSEATVPVLAREPETFLGDSTGTALFISSLRENWTRGMARNAQRAVTSICSPFEEKADFKPRLDLDPDNGWLRGIIDSKTVIEQALFHVSGRIWGVRDQGNFVSYDYKFTPPRGMDRVEERTERVDGRQLPKAPGRRRRLDPDDAVDSNLSDYDIGEIKFTLHIFDLDPQVLSLTSTDQQGIRQFLQQNGGIRVYRDGMRVYNYGEPEDDWLNLGGRRVNVPTQRVSNNILTGAFSLSLEYSSDLVEKTNREGFVENEAYRAFRNAVMRTVERITVERNLDKQRIRNAYGGQNTGLVETVAELREALHVRNLLDEFAQYLDRIEGEYLAFRERLLTAAGAGLGLAVVLHEAERGIGELRRAIERDVPDEGIRELANHLSELVDSLAYITRRSGRRVESAKQLVHLALTNTYYRLRYHSVEVENGFENEMDDFEIDCHRRLIISTLMNLIDNSIYWLDQKSPNKKTIYVGPSREFSDGPAIVVADNGPGFSDPPELLVDAFVSTKPDGMGLGLHLANEVMKNTGGRLHFPGAEEVSLPRGANGAKVALVFPKKGN